MTLKLVAADYGDPGGENGSQKYWDALARDFTQLNSGITIDVTVLSWNDVDAKVAEMVKAGDPPDIAQIGSYASYADQDLLYSAGDLLPIPVQADFLPTLAAAGEVHRMQYGLPFAASTRLLFYNKDLFTEAGLDPDKPPESWNELRDAARALKATGVKHPYGLPLGPEEAPAETMMWMLGDGGGYTDTGGSYIIDSADNIEAFNWLRDNLINADLTGPNPEKTDRQQVFDAFTRGEVGMLNGHPTLMQQAAREDVKYGTTELPGRGGAASSTMGVADWIMAFKKNGHRKEIGEFLAFAFSEKNHYDFVSRYDLLPVTTSGSERMRGDSEQRKLRKFLEQLPTAEFYPVGKVSWGEVSSDIKQRIGEVVAPDGDPARVLGSIQRAAETAESSSGS
nr:extracellular solute-binding protein [Streptomyces gossypii]